MMFKILKLLIICSSLIVFAGCQKKEQSKPVFNIKGIKTSITRIQISPLAFDGANVVVLGFVEGIKNLEDKQEVLVLTDKYGNSINVEFTEMPELDKHDTVIVGGKYRKNKNIIISEKIIEVTVNRDGIKPSNSFDKTVNKR